MADRNITSSGRQRERGGWGRRGSKKDREREMNISWSTRLLRMLCLSSTKKWCMKRKQPTRCSDFASHFSLVSHNYHQLILYYHHLTRSLSLTHTHSRTLSLSLSLSLSLTRSLPLTLSPRHSPSRLSSLPFSFLSFSFTHHSLKTCVYTLPHRLSKSPFLHYHQTTHTNI